MYAVVCVGGTQYKVEKDQIFNIDRIGGEPGDIFSFNKVALISSGETVEFGTPMLYHCKVKAEIISEVRGEKVIVFKKKRRKNHQRSNGYKDRLTRVKILEIIVN